MPELTSDQAIQALKGLPEERRRAILARLSPDVKKGIMAKLAPVSQSTPQTPSSSGPEERTGGNYASEIARGVGRGLKNDAVGLYQTITHPTDTSKSLVRQTAQAGVDAALAYKTNSNGAPVTSAALAFLENAPMIGGMVQHAEQGGTRMGSPEGAGAAAEGITTFSAPEAVTRFAGPMVGKLREMRGRAAETATGTGPAATAELVKKTQAENETAASKYEGKVSAHREEAETAAHETRGRELEHGVKQQAADEANAKAQQEHEQAVQVVDASNKAKMDEHASRTRSVEQENAAAQEEYEAAKNKAQELEKAAKEQSTQKGQLARQINQQSSRLIERLKTIKANWKDSAEMQRQKNYKPVGKLDVMYDRLRQATSAQSVPIETVANAVRRAQERLKGSAESIKQFNDILSKEKQSSGDDFVYQGGQKFGPGTPLYESVKATEEGIPGKEPASPLRFSDLQGYYTELGNKLAAGNLLPDVYQAMRSLQSDIGGEMKGMAAKSGVSSLFSQAQSAYRDYMQTFRESSGPNHSGSPISQALDAKDPAYAIKPLTDEETAQRVRNILSRFDPAVNGQGGAAALYDNLRNANRQFDSLGNPIKVPESPVIPVAKEPPVAPALQPRPGAPTPSAVEPPSRVLPSDRPVEPEAKKIGTEDVRGAKSEALKDRAALIRRYTLRASIYVTGYRSLIAVGRAMAGDPAALAALPADIAEGVAVAGGGQMFANFLESPRIMRLLTEPTARDLAQIPPELRGGLKPIVDQAQKQGIKVDPRLLALTGAAAGFTGAATQQLQRTRDSQQQNTRPQ